MTSPERKERVAEPKVIPAVKIADVSDEVLSGMRDIYYELTFGPGKKDWYDSDLRILRRFLDDRSFTGLKSGAGAKLQMRPCRGTFDDEVVGFDYNPNLRKGESGYDAGEANVEIFRQRAHELLLGKGLLFTAPDLKF